MLQYVSKIMRHAVATGRADRDITADLRGALPPVKETHHAALVEPKAIGALMRAIDGYQGYLGVMKNGLRSCRGSDTREQEAFRVQRRFVAEVQNGFTKFLFDHLACQPER
jgi:hypothetical protein